MKTISYLSSDCDAGDGGMRTNGPVTECSIIEVHHVQLAMPAGGEETARRLHDEPPGVRWIRD